MNLRKKYTFTSFTILVTLTVLISRERQIRFAHGFHPSASTSERVLLPCASKVTTRIKPTNHIPKRRLARRRTARNISSRSSLVVSATNNVYGRGADIWPESNNDVIKLSDSFPNGIVPYSAAVAIEQTDAGNATTKLQQRPRKYIKRILRRAASKEGLDNENEIGSIGRIPIAIALSLIVRGMVRPLDVALVASWTAYFTILNMTAQSLRDNGGPLLPAVPPQGHIPMVLSNPLGMRFERSSTYRRWLKLGALVGLIGPLAWLLATVVVPPLRGAAGVELEAARVVGRPLFLMCCQMTTEAISKRNLIPLPLRVLIPIVYNASRLAYLWHWGFASTNLSLGKIGRALGIINAVYWAINLFAFLIPIASIRYMRAHFFGVEAEGVTTRIGLEETVGILPNNG